MSGAPASTFRPRVLTRARLRRWLAGSALLGAAPLLAATAYPVPGTHLPARAQPPVPQAQQPVPVQVVHGRKVRVPQIKPWRRPATAWPAPGTATVALPGPAAGGAAGGGAAPPAGSRGLLAGPGPRDRQAGNLPVWAGPVAGPAGSPSRVTVTLAPHASAAAAGITGAIFTVSRADGLSAAGRLHLSIGYSGFAYAYGGDYASRLRLVALPACALTTPRVAACRQQTPLGSADNVRKHELGADVTLPVAPGSAAGAPAGSAPAASAPAASAPAASAPAGSAAAAAPAAGTLVLAATSGTSGSGGDFTATPLSEAGTWQAGGSSGAFTYTYPVNVPPVPGGLAPEVNLKYDSQSVDGLTSSTGNQASWIGDGWQYAPGFIDRSYKSCQQTSAKTGDLCWSSDDTTTLSLGGSTTTLVQDSSSGAWHPEADNGQKVQYLTGTSNGTHDGDYWVITDPDGTKYYFGLNQLPGYASGDTATGSAWTAPVYATSSGQPCYNSSFGSSHCNQAWRWNLDYVTDSHGNAIAYYYNKETNYYAADKGTTGSASYTQGGALAKAQYGLRAGSVYGVTPAGEVDFSTDTSRTDVPTDLSCSSGATCNVQSPTFWTKYELTGITTKALSGTTLGAVDSWALAHSYPSTGDPSSPPALWLSSITRTGKDGTSVALPPVSFTPTLLPNRVMTPTDLNDGYSIITRARMTKIVLETGGIITVNYLAPSGACTGSGSFPAPDSNTLLCYPDYWTPPGATSPVLDWFNKYAVNTVTQQDTTGNAVPVQAAYSYSGAAWHYNDDALTRSANRTWDQWRGFRTVTTENGTAPDPVTETKDTYFQGMNGDYQSGGGTSSASLSSAQSGDTVTDSPQFAGMNFEDIADNGAGGSKVTDTVTIPYSSAATADQPQPSPLPDLKSFMTGTRETKVFTALAAGGTRESDTTYTHDSDGRVTSVSDVPDTGNPAEDTCTTTTYATNTSAWILDLPAEEKVVSVPCGTTPSLPADAVSDTLSFYDGATSLSGDTPAQGDVTEKQLATSYNGSTPVYTTQAQATYDEYGRTLTSTDADNRTTTTAYTPATGAEPTSITVTDPMGLATTTTYDPARDLPLTVTSPAGWVTTKQYDALGRLTSAWTPGHTTSGNAEYTFSYDVSNSAPSVISTSTLEPAGNYLTLETLYDALGRVRETQAETADGNRTVSDTLYNSDGWKYLESDPYYTTGAPSSSLVAAQDSKVPSQTGYVYDGAGRVIKQVSYSFATETWETDTSYGGSYTTVVPPAGGTPQTTFTDGRGLTTAIYQYHAGVPADPSDPASDYDATSYGYTPANKLASITDAAGNKWSYSYDLAGDQVSQTTPDSGTTASTYDAAGQLLTATNADGKQVSYSQDADGRKTAEYDTTGGAAPSSADEIASWTYDTLAKGQLSSSTSFYQGSSFTEKIIGYNGFGLPTGTETVIPSTTLTGALAGTYIQEDTYTSTGQLQKYVDSAAGGLPQETVSYGYDNAGQPTGVGGNWSYVPNLSYTELGQPQEYQFGTTNAPVWAVNSYDQQTNRLTEEQTVAGTSATVVDDRHYGYDNVGLVTSEADTPPGGPSQVQCFQYDYLGRLTQAWAQGAAGCASSPSQSAEGGAAPYWNSYRYNTVNDLTSVTATPPAGAATTTTSTYPAAGSPQPHAVSAQSVSGPGGSATTSFSYDAAGQTSKISGPSGTQNLSWTADGLLASLSQSGGTTNYVYDASGTLLLQADPGSITLYLPDEQLVLDNVSGTVSGTRFYTLGGVTVATRTSAGAVDYLLGDQQGTAMLAIDSQSLAVSRRYYDPYGNPLGTPPPSWPGDKGFVGGSADAATGLTNLGAREYSPASSSFLTTDPLLAPYKPQDLNPYAYAVDSPATSSDPTGAICTAGFCDPYPYGGPPPHRGGGNGNSGRTQPTAAPPPPYLPAASLPAGLLGLILGGAPPPPHVIRTVRTPSQHQASAGTCSVADLRFGINPGCRPATPSSSSSGGSGFGWLVGAWHWVYKHRHGVMEVAGGVGFGACLVLSVGACAGVGLLIAGGNYLVDRADTGSWTGASLEHLAFNVGMVGLGGVAGGVESLAAKDAGLINEEDKIVSSPAISREWGKTAEGLDRWRHAAQAPVNFGRTGTLWGGNAVIGQLTCADPIYHPGC